MIDGGTGSGSSAVVRLQKWSDFLDADEGGRRGIYTPM